MTTAAMATVEASLLASLSYRVAMRRQSLRRQKVRSMAFLSLYATSSNECGPESDVDIFQHFACHTRLPVRLDDIREHILDEGWIKSIRFYPVQLDPNILPGFIRVSRWQPLYGEEGIHAEISTRRSWMRVSGVASYARRCFTCVIALQNWHKLGTMSLS